MILVLFLIILLIILLVLVILLILVLIVLTFIVLVVVLILLIVLLLVLLILELLLRIDEVLLCLQVIRSSQKRLRERIHSCLIVLSCQGDISHIEEIVSSCRSHRSYVLEPFQGLVRFLVVAIAIQGRGKVVVTCQ